MQSGCSARLAGVAGEFVTNVTNSLPVPVRLTFHEMSDRLDLNTYLETLGDSPLATWSAWDPWELTARAASVVEQLLANLPSDEFVMSAEGIAVHRSAHVEGGSVLKGPLVVGAHSFVAAGAYLRGGCWLGRDCVVGPGAELKSSFVLDGSKLAHFNFVGDSVIGTDVNLEAGAVICNYRNERPNGGIRVRIDGDLQAIAANKFGALVGDGSRLGANAIVAPGALLARGTLIERGALCDQEIDVRPAQRR